MRAAGDAPTVAGVPIKIDRLSKTPTYLQLAAELRRIIREEPGKLENDELAGAKRLPSTHELMRETGLAQNTIRSAIRILDAEGIVVSVPGRGVYVR
jgi:DNA-binding GntR family transcriptional regulator